LPLCFGEATKFAGELLDADKAYDAVIKLGVTTQTADAEGEVREVRPVQVSDDQVAAVLASFKGEILQVPPMHSALKRDGKPLYEYARQGIELERVPRRVTIHDIRMLDLNGDLLSISVDCSKGTYIRTLAEDIGASLGCGAHLAALRRTRIGSLVLNQTMTLAQIEASSGDERDALLAPVDSLLDRLPCADLDASSAERLNHGQSVRWTGIPGRFRVYHEATFLGLCELDDEGWLTPRRLVANVPKNEGPNS
jgi:tRNA pseudouridine55 synthase